MRFEYLVLLIVAFNVVTALARRRAKAKKARKTQNAREARGDVRPASSAPEAASGRRQEGESQEMPSLGRDILDQIARDLGLKTPRPAPPASRSPGRSLPERPVPRRISERAATRPAPAGAMEDRETEKPYAASGRPGDAKEPPRRSAAAQEAPAVRKIPTSTPVPTVSLREPGKLREALVWKEVLDGPVSRRPPSAFGRRGRSP